MSYMIHRPAYQARCVMLNKKAVNGNTDGCGWSGKFYFDVPLPASCPRCAGSIGQRLKVEVLTTRPE